MTRKQTAVFLVFPARVIGYGWYMTVVDPARPTDIYPPWSKLMLLIPASVFWGIGVFLMI
jgi:hypothetical protein